MSCLQKTRTILFLQRLYRTFTFYRTFHDNNYFQRNPKHLKIEIALCIEVLSLSLTVGHIMLVQSNGIFVTFALTRQGQDLPYPLLSSPSPSPSPYKLNLNPNPKPNINPNPNPSPITLTPVSLSRLPPPFELRTRG